MKEQIVIINSIKFITHDVLQIVTEKPEEFEFTPGQATEISINKEGWKEEKRPFTFTSLPLDKYLQFTIKIYPAHNGVTSEFQKLKEKDELILHDVFGAITYKEEGLFIAGGAGVTPFISIFRYLQSKNEIGNNKLIFANKTKNDIILEQEFEIMLGENFINILSDEKADKYFHGMISEDFLKDHITDRSENVYLCGPPPMMEAVEKFLSNLKIDESLIVREAF